MGATGWVERASTAHHLRVRGGSVGRGRAAIERFGCGSCHTIPGIPSADGEVGPPLVRWVERAYIGGRLPKRPPNLIRWIESPQSVEPCTATPELGVGRARARNIAAYLYTLGDRRSFVAPAAG